MDEQKKDEVLFDDSEFDNMETIEKEVSAEEIERLKQLIEKINKETNLRNDSAE